MSLHSHCGSSSTAPCANLRHDWSTEEALALYALPLPELLYQAQTVHRQHFDPAEIQVSTLLSIKTGGCAENCGYCSQSAHFDTGIKASKLCDTDTVLEAAKIAKANGSTRFCMGAAWREPKERDMPALVEMIQQVRELGMETCLTAGMLSQPQAQTLKEAGLDYYNHNLDTSEAFYDKIITTRTYADRLNTLAHVRESGMKTCSGGIIGLGESREDRAALIVTLANLPEHPHSVPINNLVPVSGTPLANAEKQDTFEFVRTIAIARILMPSSYVRLSAGRGELDEAAQALCFMAGANSIFYGDTLLTTPNPETNQDKQLLDKLGMRMESFTPKGCAA
jgi:biotin synthase